MSTEGGQLEAAPLTLRTHLFFFLVLVFLGMGWGVTQPLAKIAVSTGYGHFGLVFWQLALGAIILGVICIARKKSLPLTRASLAIFAMIALVGTIIPNSSSYQAIVHLQSGVISVLLAVVPMMAFPIALALGQDRFGWGRFFGLSLGLAGVLIIILPDASLPTPDLAGWVLVALIAPFCYALEGNLVARFGLQGMDPVQALWGASIVGTLMSFPLAVGSGQWISPWQSLSAADAAIGGLSFIHAMVYATYVWLVSRAGPTFAVQVSYLVTGFGVIWAMLLLGERYSPFLWSALVLMLVGMAFVVPRPRLS